jgi:hypothetical protein
MAWGNFDGILLGNSNREERTRQLTGNGRSDADGQNRLQYGGRDIAWLSDIPALIGDVTNGANVGTGAEVFRDKTGTVLNFRRIRGQSAIVTVTQVGDDIVIDTNPTNFPITHTIYVDASRGNNTTGTGESFAFPFLTPNGALDWLVANVAANQRQYWQIYVLPGLYNDSSDSGGTPRNYVFQLGNRGDVNLYLCPGVVVDAPAGGNRGCFGTFNTGTLNGNLNIFGYGTVLSTVAASWELFYLQVDSTVQRFVNVNLSAVSNTMGTVCFSVASTGGAAHQVNFNVASIATSNTLAVNTDNNTLNVNAGSLLYTGTNRPAIAEAASVTNIRVISSVWTNMRFLNTNIGTLTFEGSVLHSGVDPAIFSGTTGTVLINGLWTISADAFWGTSAMGTLRFHGDLTMSSNCGYISASPLNANPTIVVHRDGRLIFDGTGANRLVAGQFIAGSSIELNVDVFAINIDNTASGFAFVSLDGTGFTYEQRGSLTVGTVPRCFDIINAATVVFGDADITSSTNPAVRTQNASTLRYNGNFTVTIGAIGDFRGSSDVTWITEESTGANGTALFTQADTSIFRPSAGRYVNTSAGLVWAQPGAGTFLISSGATVLIRPGGAVSAITNAQIAQYYIQGTSWTNATTTPVVGAPVAQFQVSAAVL